MPSNQFASPFVASPTATRGVRPPSASLQDSLIRGRKFEAFGDRLRGRHASNVEDLSQEQNRLARGAGSAVQQKFQAPTGGSFSQRLEQSLRRGKARQGILNRGDAAIRNQQLKDRLSLARSSVARRGALQQTSENAERLRVGLDASERSAKSQVGQAFAGAGGFLVGGAIRGFSDNLFNSDTTIPVSVDQGTAAADFFSGSDLGSFDFFGSGGTGNA